MSTMNALNTVFFDEFKSLDQLCRDIYGDDATPKLGVTLYLEHMEADFLSGRRFVPNWESDYIKLKCARNMRNEFAHSPDSFSYLSCSQPEIDFVRSFHDRILNGSDPLTALRKQTVRKADNQPQAEYGISLWNRRSESHTSKPKSRRNPAPWKGLAIIALIILLVIFISVGTILCQQK